MIFFHRACFLALALLALASCRSGCGPEGDQPLRGLVFHDGDGDGMPGPGERGLPGVVVSNGRNLMTTGDRGAFTMPLLPGDDLTVTVPEGYILDLQSIVRHNPAPGSPITFALRPSPGPPQEAALRVALISDTHLDQNDESALTTALQALSFYSPHLVLVTGDIGHQGDKEAYLAWARSLEALRRTRRAQGLPPLPIMAIAGNHDWAETSLAPSFRHLVAPWRYSFVRGPLHVAALGWSPDPEDGLDWLEQDLALAKAGTLKALMHHGVPNRPLLERFHRMGASLVLSGHFHAPRDETVENVRVLATQPLLRGGLDVSPSGFRLMEIREEHISSQVITLPPRPWARFIRPWEGATLPPGPLTITAEALDRAGERATVVQLFLNGQAQGPMKPAGGWAHQATVQVDPGPALLTIATAEASASVSLHVAEGNLSEPAPARGEWPEAGGGPDRRGWRPWPLRPPLRPAWVTPVGGLVRGGVALSRGILVVSRLRPGGLVALRADTGELLWSHEMEGEVGAPPSICGSRAVAMDTNGHVTALDLATGQYLWTRSLGELQPKATEAHLLDRPWTLASPLCLGKHVCVASANVLACLDGQSGRVAWSRAVDGQSWPQLASPALWGDAIVHIFGRNPLGLAAFDRQGQIKWSLLSHGYLSDPAPTPVWAGLLGLLPTGGGDILGATSKGQVVHQVWEEKERDWRYPLIATPAAGLDRFVLAWRNGMIQARNLFAGGSLWETIIESSPLVICAPGYPANSGALVSPPIIAGPTVFVATLGGELMALDLADGSVMWQTSHLGPVVATMALGQGSLFLATLGGTVVAFSPEEASP